MICSVCLNKILGAVVPIGLLIIFVIATAVICAALDRFNIRIF